jgi:magnesium chelatase subunit ChlI-like protein
MQACRTPPALDKGRGRYLQSVPRCRATAAGILTARCGAPRLRGIDPGWCGSHSWEMSAKLWACSSPGMFRLRGPGSAVNRLSPEIIHGGKRGQNREKPAEVIGIGCHVGRHTPSAPWWVQRSHTAAALDYPSAPPRLQRTLPEMIDTTRIPRVAGRTGAHTAVVTMRPYRIPPHPIADVGVIGGGQVPLPGEVSLAPHGMLCLEELPEFRRHGLEVFCQPREEGVREPPLHGRPRSDGAGGVRHVPAECHGLACAMTGGH